MSRDLIEILKVKLAQYSIRQGQLARLIGKGPGHISDILQGRKNPTMKTFQLVLEAAEELRPGFMEDYWTAVAGFSVTLEDFIKSLDSVQLGLVLTLAGQRLIDAQAQTERKKVSIPQDHPIAV